MSSPSKSAARAETAKAGGALTRALRMAEAGRSGSHKGKRAETRNKVTEEWASSETARNTANALVAGINDRSGQPMDLEPAQVSDLIAGRLVAPCIGPSVPASYDVNAPHIEPTPAHARLAQHRGVVLGRVITQPGEIEICRALQDAGVMQESDFKGRFDEAISTALTRWARDCFDGREPVIFSSLSMMWSDDMEHFSDEGLNTEEWVRWFGGDLGRQAGFLGLMWDEHSANCAIIGRQVARLEELHSGLGAGLVNTVERGMGQIGGFGFQAAESWIESWEDQYDEQDIADDPTILTLDRFHAVVPAWVCQTSQMDRGLFDRALAWCHMIADAYTEADSPTQQFDEADEFAWVLERTIALSDALGEYYSSKHGGCQIGVCNEEMRSNAHASVYLKWEIDDEMDRIVDDNYNMMMGDGLMSNFVWINGWQIGIQDIEGRERQGGTLADAISNMGTLLRILGLTDQLLAWMDTSETGEERQVECVVHNAIARQEGFQEAA